MTRFGFGIASAIVAASLAAPLLVGRYDQFRMRQKEQALRELGDQVSTLGRENEHLSKILSLGNPAESLSKEQLLELLRLRSEAGRLRQQTNTIRQLQEENTGLEARSIAAPAATIIRTGPEEVSDDTVTAMKNILAEIQPALQRFAEDHDGKAPTSFSDLRNYFPTQEGRRMTGLYTFGFIRDEGPKPADALILREQTWRDIAGVSARVYGFRDYQATEVRLPASTEGPEQHFQDWEQRHLTGPPDPTIKSR
jgi:hypothetical protein